ncbi:MAG TPA: hypothetical protein V6C58_01660 [Allocoleopsis sp.]
MKNFFISMGIFCVLYILLAFATAPFFISWGTRRNFISKIYVYFIGGPVNTEHNWQFVFINSIIWFFLFYGISKVVYRLK